MGPAAVHKGSAHYAPGGPLGNLRSGKKTKGESNMDWARKKGTGRWGSRQKQAQEPAVS